MKTDVSGTFASATRVTGSVVQFLGALLICVLCLSILPGCGGNKSTESVAVDDGTLTPLASGNTWTYQLVHYGEVRGSLSLTIVGMADYSGETYYRLSELYITEGSPGPARYTVMRNGAEGLYWCDKLCGDSEGYHPASCDGSLFQYPVADGTQYTDVDTCRCSVDDPIELAIESVDVQVDYETVDVPAGTFDVISYACTESGSTPTRTYSFAPGIGLVRIVISVNDVEEGALELVSCTLE